MKTIVILLATAAALLAQTYDVVLAGGRVMDPESGLDAVRNVGVTGGRIAAISTAPLQGRRRLARRDWLSRRAIPEEAARQAIAYRGVMIASG